MKYGNPRIRQKMAACAIGRTKKGGKRKEKPDQQLRLGQAGAALLLRSAASVPSGGRGGQPRLGARQLESHLLRGCLRQPQRAVVGPPGPGFL